MVTSLTWISRGPEVGINGLFHPINIDPNFPWHPSTTYFLKVEKRPMLHPFQPMKKKHAIHRKSTLFKGIFQMVLEVFMDVFCQELPDWEISEGSCCISCCSLPVEIYRQARWKIMGVSLATQPPPLFQEGWSVLKLFWKKTRNGG